MKNRVTVTIAGQEYTLVGTEEASYTEKVAAHVDAKVEEVARALGLLDLGLDRDVTDLSGGQRT